MGELSQASIFAGWGPGEITGLVVAIFGGSGALAGVRQFRLQYQELQNAKKALELKSAELEDAKVEKAAAAENEEFKLIFGSMQQWLTQQEGIVADLRTRLEKLDAEREEARGVAMKAIQRSEMYQHKMAEALETCAKKDGEIIRLQREAMKREETIAEQNAMLAVAARAQEKSDGARLYAEQVLAEVSRQVGVAAHFGPPPQAGVSNNAEQ
jgi:hypothetical protein